MVETSIISNNDLEVDGLQEETMYFDNDVEVDDLGVNSFKTSEKDTEVSNVPFIGMSFTTLDEAQKYYEEYGRRNGFWIRIRTTNKREKTNEVISRQFVCTREGKHDPKTGKVGELNDENGETKNKRKNRNCSTLKYGCEAQMRVKKGWDDEWKVTVFEVTPNHSLVSPRKRMKMRSNQYLPKAVTVLAEAFHKENIKISKITSVLGGEHMGFDSRRMYNKLNSVKLKNVNFKNLDVGDAHSMMLYFQEKKTQNPQFFYDIQCDDNMRATNFFWVDAQSRMAYQYFGDVICFDTTYRTNKYKMPFAPFTGVNHYWQTIQFGCALLQDETEVTFTWLFETWLAAMGGRPPNAIITDQDLAMKGAIATVFPNTIHRLCIWHIQKKFVDKLSHVYYEKSNFKKDVNKCLWFTYKVEDFEENWMLLIKNYGLESNEWLQQLYAIRESWVPVYNRDTFFAGMNTTGRSEGINSFFNDFVTWTTNLTEFVVKYEQALRRINERETHEDFVSEHKSRILKGNEFLLKHAANIYTRNLFNKFNDEMNEVCNFRVEDNKNVDGLQLYTVSSKVNETQKFIVSLDQTTYAGKCECKNFEFVGIICRHILKVFVRLDIDVIPDHFILSRWCQKANKFRCQADLVHNDGKEETDILRLGHMCQESTKIACLASTSDEAYKFYIETMKSLSENIVKICDSVHPSVNKSSDLIKQPDNLHSTAPSQNVLLDPNISQTDF